MLNEEMIEKYRKNIENLFKQTQYDRLEKLDEDIKSILDNAFKDNKISEDEYDILNEFLEVQLRREQKSSFMHTYKIENLSSTFTNIEQEMKQKKSNMIKEGEER